ncbi:MAG: RNA methyltransferase [Lachnospiraceae bacterium]|nr:RNA methyltransferase [Lachnospiraceae bacterium]
MITSISNNGIKNIIKLCTNAKARREQGVFVSEGIRMFNEAPLVCVKEVYINESFHEKIFYNKESVKADIQGEDRLRAICREKLEKTGYTMVADQVFKKLSQTISPQGILCVIKQSRWELAQLTQEKEEALHILVLEEIQDPGNMGTMIRTAEAAGYDLILASEGTVDVYNPKVIRSTMGSVFRVPVIYTENLKTSLRFLKEKGVRIYAAHLRGKKDYDKIDYPGKMAVMIGNEGNGLSDMIADEADEYIKIPMKGKVESLNASVASALLMFNSVSVR